MRGRSASRPTPSRCSRRRSWSRPASRRRPSTWRSPARSSSAAWRSPAAPALRLGLLRLLVGPRRRADETSGSVGLDDLVLFGLAAVLLFLPLAPTLDRLFGPRQRAFLFLDRKSV